MQKYNKAIRDRIPEIIESKGQKCKVVVLSDQDFLVQMERKLSEELDEYKVSKSPEELADILEVLYRIAELKGLSRDQFEKLRAKKALDRGAFTRNLFLIETD